MVRRFCIIAIGVAAGTRLAVRPPHGVVRPRNSRERIGEADHLVRAGEGHRPHEILIFSRPKRIGLEPLQHTGKDNRGFGGRVFLSAASDIRRHRGAHEIALLCHRLRSSQTEPGRRYDLAHASDGSAKVDAVLDVLPLAEKALPIAMAS
jgi:hypothetical protein